MTLEAQVLKDDAVRAVEGGYRLDLHLAWYRSLPLSCIEDVDLTIDGDRVPRDQVRLSVGDRELGLEEVAGLDDEWWFVQDALSVRAPANEAKPAGSTVDVDLVVATRIPYIIIGPQTALVQRTRVVKKVAVK